MKNLAYKKGEVQLTIATGMAFVAFVVSPVVAYYSGQASSARDIAAISERVARLEEAVPAIKEDTREIRESLQSIEKALRIAPSVVQGRTLKSE